MEFSKIKYKDVTPGMSLYIETEKNKKGEPHIVITAKPFSPNKFCYCVTFDNGDKWFGLAERELKVSPPV